MFIKPFLRLLLAYTPVFLKRMVVREIYVLTIQAFTGESHLPVSHPSPKITTLSYEKMLKEYAHYTKVQAEERLNNNHMSTNHHTIQETLFRKAEARGEYLRKKLKLQSIEDVMLVSRLIYKILQIDFYGNAEGEVRINNCYFKTFYSPEICRLISCLDAGLLSGLSGGGRLFFFERITEGSPVCRARILLTRAQQ